MIGKTMTCGLAAIAGLTASPVWAQLQTPGQVADPRLDFWIVMLVCLFLSAGVMLGALLSSRRTHLD
ncbi:MAG: hypothetical protein AAF823_10665 [Planctomycetota bacterium]